MFILCKETLVHISIFPLNTYILNQNLSLPQNVHCEPTFQGIGIFLFNAKVKKIKFSEAVDSSRSVSNWHREDIKSHWVYFKHLPHLLSLPYSTFAKPLPDPNYWECVFPSWLDAYAYFTVQLLFVIFGCSGNPKHHILFWTVTCNLNFCCNRIKCHL